MAEQLRNIERACICILNWIVKAIVNFHEYDFIGIAFARSVKPCESFNSH